VSRENRSAIGNIASFLASEFSFSVGFIPGFILRENGFAIGMVSRFLLGAFSFSVGLVPGFLPSSDLFDLLTLIVQHLIIAQ